MRTVGTFEAKTHLSKLLDQVATGERFTIERHGVPVAVLLPADPSKNKPTGETIAELRQFRAGHRLNGMSIREMIETGRR